MGRYEQIQEAGRAHMRIALIVDFGGSKMYPLVLPFLKILYNDLIVKRKKKLL